MEEALKSFEQIEKSIYQYREIGRSPHGETLACDCKPRIDESGVNRACGPDSGCINRLTSIECLKEDCSCGLDCQNQRFQKRQYANIVVFDAGKKGFGIKATQPLDPEDFIYEYVGEVIDEKKFRTRMELYDRQGVKHFYFMMLQRGEYIDATRKGGLARFLNHSCNPNCYVDKWVVGTKLCMGIFAKRHIDINEELTFDYNVDRYGADAQPCYCGETQCRGILGGKTQTDDALFDLPRSIFEALSLDELDIKSLCKGIPKKKLHMEASEIIGPLKLPEIKDISGVTKIMSVLMQSKEDWIIKKSLERLASTEDPNIQRQIMKLHGYQILGTVITDFKENNDIVSYILNILSKWPKITRNKISSAKIEPTVQELADASTDLEVRNVAKALLEEWSRLDFAYRIPRRAKTDISKSEESISSNVSSNSVSATSTPEPRGPGNGNGISNIKKQKAAELRKEFALRAFRDFSREWLPAGWEASKDESGRIYYFNKSLNLSQWEFPKETKSSSFPIDKADDFSLEKALEQANVQIEKARAEKEAKRKLRKENRSSREKKKKHKHTHENGKATSKPHHVLEEFKLGLVRFIPNVTARYQERLGKERFKKRAKEIVTILFEKEKKRKPIRSSPTLGDNEKEKMKVWALTYMHKVWKKYNDSPNSNDTFISKELDTDKAPSSAEKEEESQQNQINMDHDSVSESESDSESESSGSETDADKSVTQKPLPPSYEPSQKDIAQNENLWHQVENKISHSD